MIVLFLYFYIIHTPLVEDKVAVVGLSSSAEVCELKLELLKRTFEGAPGTVQKGCLEMDEVPNFFKQPTKL